MPDDDWALGQNEVDVRNEARREYNRGDAFVCSDPEADWIRDMQQIALCTNDERCQAAADEHDPHCPVERSLQDEFGGF